MEEKVLIKSERYNILKGLKIFIILCFIATLIWSILEISNHIGWYDVLSQSKQSRYGNAISYAFSEFFEDGFEFAMIPTWGGLFISFLVYAWMHSYELTVTDKRVYGKVAFGKRVDLPVDSLSATATITIFKGISVSTSSGRISFLIIKNANKIYEILNQLLIERQSKNKDERINHVEVKSDEVDKIKKFKELLDNEIITQEEFDAKKKELLGL